MLKIKSAKDVANQIMRDFEVTVEYDATQWNGMLVWEAGDADTVYNILTNTLTQDRQAFEEAIVGELEGMRGKWIAAYMPADSGKDPSKWGFNTEKEAWSWIEARLTPCPLDPKDTSGKPCDSCMAEWMVYQIPEVDQALDQAIATIKSIYQNNN